MKITTRIIRGPSENLFKGRTISWYPPYEEIHAAVSELQASAVRRHKFKWAFSDFQIHLFRSIVAEKTSLKHLYSRKAQPEEEKALAGIVGQSELHLNALLRIGDGVAFRFLDYNLPLFQTLGGQAATSVSPGDAGLIHEIDIAALLTDHTEPSHQILICGLNEVTNIGDIILKTSEAFEIIEVKQGKRSRGARIRRQLKRMESVRDFFETGTTSFQNLDARLQKFPERSHHLLELESALIRSVSEGPQIIELSPFQFVYCFNSLAMEYDDIRNCFESIERLAKERFGKLGYTLFRSLDFRFRSSVGAPITAFPFSPDYIAHLLLGGSIYVSVICWDLLKTEIEKHNWKVVDLLDLEPTDLQVVGFPMLMLFRADDPNKNITWPVDFLLSIAFELVDFEKFMNAIDSFLNSAPEQKTSWIPIYENDYRLWV